MLLLLLKEEEEEEDLELVLDLTEGVRVGEVGGEGAALKGRKSVGGLGAGRFREGEEGPRLEEEGEDWEAKGCGLFEKEGWEGGVEG